MCAEVCSFLALRGSVGEPPLPCLPPLLFFLGMEVAENSGFNDENYSQFRAEVVIWVGVLLQPLNSGEGPAP